MLQLGMDQGTKEQVDIQVAILTLLFQEASKCLEEDIENDEENLENPEENLVKVKREDVKNPRKREENLVKADVAVKEDDK